MRQHSQGHPSTRARKVEAAFFIARNAQGTELIRTVDRKRAHDRAGDSGKVLTIYPNNAR